MRIIVIGGGAAGFFGAIAAAKSNPTATITLLEAGRQPLAKVRISGGGRCNVTHACFEAQRLVQNYPRGGKALLGAFSRFQARDTVDWFANQGINLKTEADGRMFPITDSSETIIKCLMGLVLEYNVKLRTSTAVNSVETPAAGNRFEINLKSGEKLECDRLLLATGSSPLGYKIAQHLGHDIEPPVPSLFTFNIIDKQLRELSGVSVNPVRLRLSIPGQPQLEQRGPLLITHWGLSGPAVLKLSAWGARILHDSQYQAKLSVNWLPDLQPEAVRQQLLCVKDQWGKKAIALHRGVNFPHRLWQYILGRLSINPQKRWAEIPKNTLNQLVRELTQGEYILKGKGVFKDEFVTCGGVKLKQVNFKTMESRIVPGLHFAGEILDIDGITGGFNFQSAWTTAYLAGSAMGNEPVKNKTSPS